MADNSRAGTPTADPPGGWQPIGRIEPWGDAHDGARRSVSVAFLGPQTMPDTGIRA
jgi:hypothetical protein